MKASYRYNGGSEIRSSAPICSVRVEQKPREVRVGFDHGGHYTNFYTMTPAEARSLAAALVTAADKATVVDDWQFVGEVK